MDKDPGGGDLSTDEDGHESRLLTKKQISDMAFSIRELAKKLSHIRVRLNVRNIFILTKAHDENLIADTRETAEWLLGRNKGYRVYVLCHWLGRCVAD